jgi:hypothetical protein
MAAPDRSRVTLAAVIGFLVVGGIVLVAALALGVDAPYAVLVAVAVGAVVGGGLGGLVGARLSVDDRS